MENIRENNFIPITKKIRIKEERNNLIKYKDWNNYKN